MTDASAAVSPAAMRFLPMGRAALLVELDGLDAAMSLYAAIEARRAALRAAQSRLPHAVDRSVHAEDRSAHAEDDLDARAGDAAPRTALMDPFAGVTEVVPAARTVLIRFDPLFTDRDELVAAVRGLDLGGHVERHAKTVTVPVVYDGEDLDAVADLLGVSAVEVVNRHAGHAWTAAFGGFAPGFTYLTGGDPIFDVPRRANPRLAVPAGAVGLAGTFSGVYPRPSSGGWQLIGTTDEPMWDDHRNPPALIQPGDTVRFEPVREWVAMAASVDADRDVAVTGNAVHRESFCETLRETCDGRISDSPHAHDAADATHGVTCSSSVGLSRDDTQVDDSACAADLTIDDPGMFAVFEDDGRRAATMGVTGSGAADPAAFHLANELVGNPIGTPAIETAGGGLRLTVHRTLVLAVTGAPIDVAVSGAYGRTRIMRQEAFLMQPGEQLELGFPQCGFRNYIAVQGGFDAPCVLGSASADTLSGLGPAALTPGTPLAIATSHDSDAARDAVPDAVRDAATRASSDEDAAGDTDWGSAHPAHTDGAILGVPAPVVRTVYTVLTVGQPQPWSAGLPATGEVTTLDVVLGPRDDWFTDQGITDLFDQEWTVTAQSNRVGLRLHGTRPLERRDTRELASEGMVPGAIEIPSNGQPVLFLRDQPVTGGYPVIAVLTKPALALAGQLPPGARIRFRNADGPSPATTAQAVPSASRTSSSQHEPSQTQHQTQSKEPSC
ncbi:urea amidolyase family protein [Bifidobacterium amazonense]|uniref:Urea amidolyase family protein n=1 Tax=Bifidobacterium amazonense TaxID=2809027 RepID=A0ABS9VVX0_9BIFI|nr:urea amidolyase family protein [Bifidobacterium amazonense]MCH9276256.1 urea amidolyase family protein [Bifidobacterium amazonense]